MSEGLIHFPSKGIIESITDLKKEKYCTYCKNKCKETKWYDIFSFKKYTEIGKNANTGEWIYVCNNCTKKFVKDLVKQLRKAK